MSPMSVPAPRPGVPMLVVTSEQMRMRDHLVALGLAGVHLAVTALAALVWVMSGASWETFWPAFGVFVVGLLPMVSAVVLWRHSRQMYQNTIDMQRQWSQT